MSTQRQLWAAAEHQPFRCIATLSAKFTNQPVKRKVRPSICPHSCVVRPSAASTGLKFKSNGVTRCPVLRSFPPLVWLAGTAHGRPTNRKRQPQRNTMYSRQLELTLTAQRKTWCLSWRAYGFKQRGRTLSGRECTACTAFHMAVAVVEKTFCP